MRLSNRRRAARKRVIKIVLATVYITVLTMAGLGFNGTCSIFNTLARTPPGEAVAASEQGILKVTGEFDLENWLDTGDSGLVVTNVSPGKLWVYFSIEGSLGEAVQHINPVCLKAGESFEIPVRPASLGELGLLGWRNNEQTFTGKIVVRVLNNFSFYETGTVTIDGEELYARKVGEQDDPTGELGGIKSVNDLISLINEKMALLEERDQLKQEKDRLMEINDELTRDKAQLENRISMLEELVDSFSESSGNAAEPGSSGSEASGAESRDSGGTGDNEAGNREPAGNGTGGTGTVNEDPANTTPGDNGTVDSNSGNPGSGENGPGNRDVENGSGNTETGNPIPDREESMDAGSGGGEPGNPEPGGTATVETGPGGPATGGPVSNDAGTGDQSSVDAGSNSDELGKTNTGPSSGQDPAASPGDVAPAAEPSRVSKNDGEQNDL